MNIRNLKYTIFLFGMMLLSGRMSSAQTVTLPNPWQVDTLIVVPASNYAYRFPATHWPILPSLQIRNNGVPLQASSDFLVSDTLITFFHALRKGDSLRIRYRRLPVDLPHTFRLFQEEELPPAGQADSLLEQKKKKRLRKIRFENPFAHKYANLKTSGSLMRGIQIGSNRDMTLNSGLNLELSGKLTDNLEVVAALTDEATPIQPEGNTQTLQEVDKVFVRFKSPYVQGTVGDFNLEQKGTNFANLNRKLQGLTLLGKYRDHYLGATIATTRGYFNRVQFLGQEGNQGPYQLTGKNGERDIVVLAGTEHVFVDGKLMTRGESNDYVIEYGNGQIRFTNNRLITSSSRIEVDFEYFPSVQKYNRTVYNVTAGGKLFHPALTLHMNLYREADNPNQLLEGAEKLSGEEKAALQSAGDDPLKAVLDGAKQVAAGKGSYIRADTTLAGQSYQIYHYVGPGNGDYSVTFSDVGQGRGDYSRDRLGVYRWVGPQRGRYLPVKLIPLPGRHDVADARLNWSPGQKFKLISEFAVSRRDENVLSRIGDSDNQGGALQVKAQLSESDLRIAKTNLGTVQFDLNLRYVQEQFRPADRLQPPDYQRFWNILQPSLNSDQELSALLNAGYRPLPDAKIGLNVGRLQKDQLESGRYGLTLDYGDSSRFFSKANYEAVESRLKSEQITNTWQRYSAQVGKPVWRLRPVLAYRGEWRKNQAPNRLSGFRFDDLTARLDLLRFHHVQGQIALENRQDQVYDVQSGGGLIPQAKTVTGRLNLQLTGFRNTSLSLNAVHRVKDYTSRFEKIRVDTLKLLYADATVQDTVWQDRTTDLAQINLTHSRWNKGVNVSWQYRVASQQTALKEKVYLNVGQGRGNLRYDPDLQEYVPDPDGEYLLFVLPSGRFEPVTNLQTAFRLRFDPYRSIDRKSKGWRKMLRHVSGESYWRVEEETREQDVRSIYLLNLAKFQGDSTVRGTIQFNQDIYIMRHNRRLSFRLRYRDRRSTSNQFLNPGENEQRRNRETSARADWRLGAKVRSQTLLGWKQTFRHSAANKLRNRDIYGLFAGQNFSYRPWQRWEFGLEIGFGKEDNRVITYPISLWYATAKTRLTYAIPGKGRATGFYQYQTVQVTDNPQNLTVPFEMANGKKQGTSHNWQFRVEYTVAKNIVFSLYYTGRKDAGFERTIHTGQAELKAYF